MCEATYLTIIKQKTLDCLSILNQLQVSSVHAVQRSEVKWYALKG